MKRKEEPKDEYRFAFEIKDEKAHIIVYEPIITAEERERRMNDLKKTMQKFWTNYYRKKAQLAKEEAKQANKKPEG